MSSEPVEFHSYYFTLKATGVREIDDILSAIALAGKCSHSTDDWSDPRANLNGKSYIDLIQEAANHASEAFRKE